MMQRNISWLWCAPCLLLLCGALICPGTAEQGAARKHAKRQHGNLHQRPDSPKKYCDPSFSNQTAGAITQKCEFGFYREWTGPNQGQCVPCSCNGLSNECDSHTGNCVNCQFNTDGDRCERCKEGYYGNAAQRTCQPCPCPLTGNNFALACLEIGSGVVECLCKPGYYGARCERCASGYYGNPMIYGGSCQPCNCDHGTLNICDSLTGECITHGDTASDDHCHDCDGCTDALLNDLERMDDELAPLRQQLQNISQVAGSFFMLNRLEANISETKILVGRYSAAVNSLDPKTEQLEADVKVVTEDLSQLIIKTQKTLSDSHKVLEKVNGTKMKAEDLLSEVEALLTTIQNLIKQLSEVNPADSSSVPEDEAAEMLEEAQRMVEEMRRRGCSAQKEVASKEQEEAHKLLDFIRNNISVPLDTIQPAANRTAASLMDSSSSLRELAEVLLEAEDSVDRAVGLNLKNDATLQDLLRLRAHLEREQGALRPIIDMIKDQLRNITNLGLMLKESRQELERLAAQLDGAKSDLMKKLNRISQALVKVDIVIKAEEHAEELSRLASELQILLHNVTNSSSGVVNAVLGRGDYNSIINAIEKAEMAANQSKVAADLAFKDVEQGGLVHRAERLKDNASRLVTEARETQNNLKMLSPKIGSQKDRVNKQKEKGELLKKDLLAVSDDLKKIKRDDIGLLIDSAKAAASAANDTANKRNDRLRNISQELGKISFTNTSANIDDILRDAEQALKNFTLALPSLRRNLTQIEALSKKAPPTANMTESIRRIKDVIEETRSFVNRLSIATTFNGKGHIELRPPRDLEDVKAFTALDLLLNRHQDEPSKAERSRRRRQGAHRDNLFVLYLGNKDASGDYVGMAVRNNVLVCVYKLGEVVHEVKTSQITTTTNVNSTNFDRAVIHRVYQDAEVNITHNFTSKPTTPSLTRSLSNTLNGVLNLDPDSVVFYVGGYPDNFTPPVELRYPKYRGAMKLSFVNDNPVCLFNYKNAINLGEKQPYVKIPQSEVSDYYEGTGYRMAFTSKPDKKKRRLFKFHTNSRETNALLFYIGNEDSYFCVFMERGYLVLQGRQAGQELRAQSGEKVSLFDKKFIITINDKFSVNYGAEPISTDHIQAAYENYYIGGLPAQLRERDNITAPPLRGCVDHLEADSDYVEYNRTIGVSVGCPVSLLGVRAATFNSAVSVDSLGVVDKEPVMVSLGFRSTEKHGTFLRSSYQDSSSVHDLQLSLVNGFVVFKCDDYTLNSHKMYNDGSWHYVSAMRSPTGLEMSVDNVQVEAQSHTIKPSESVLGTEKFKGCITNLYTRRFDSSFIPADLSSLALTGDVVLDMCRLSPPQQAVDLPASLIQRQKNTHPRTKATRHQCKRRPTHYGGHELSEPHSWLSYNISPEDLNFRPHFSLEVRTRSSRGLLLYVAGRGDISLLALFMANGKIKLSLGQNRIIHHKKKSNDGKWHRVMFSVETHTFHLLVDGVRVTDGHLSNNAGSSLDLQNPVYLGGAPIHKTAQGHFIPKESVIGCIRDFKISEALVGEPVAHHGASPCFDGLSEPGAYFGGDGAHVVLDKYFTVSSHFDLAFELRPQHLTGLIFHVRGPKTSLNVFLLENQVEVKVNDGSGAVSVSVTPHTNLCDSKFHMVKVSKQGELVKVTVDSMSVKKAGPSPSASYSATLDSLYIGGTTKGNRVPVSSSFVGCLRNVRVNGRPVAFEAAASVVGTVNINRCPAGLSMSDTPN